MHGVRGDQGQLFRYLPIAMLSSLLSCTCGFCGFIWPVNVIIPPIVTDAELAESLDGERNAARSAGLVVAESGELTLNGREFAHTLSVGPGECAGVVVFARSRNELDRLTLIHGSDVRVTADLTASAFAAQVQWCADARAEVQIEGGLLRIYPNDEDRVFYEVYRGSGDLRRLNRGRGIDEATYAALDERDRERQTETRRALFTSQFGDEMTAAVNAGEAALMPPSTAVHAFLRTLAQLGVTQEVYPRFVATALPTRRAIPDDTPQEALAMARVGDVLFRVLAVVDFGDALEGCNVVHFAREGAEGQPLQRISIEDFVARPIPFAAPFVSDRVCSGTYAYLTSRDDQAVYTIAVVAEAPTEDEQEVVTARRASRFRLRDAPAHPMVASSREACDADPEECITVAINLAAGRYEPADPEAAQEMLNSSCHRGVATACRELAMWESASPELRASVSGRGCSLGDAKSCVLFGDAQRLGRGVAFDVEGARATYTIACTAGERSACQNRDALALLFD